MNQVLRRAGQAGRRLARQAQAPLLDRLIDLSTARKVSPVRRAAIQAITRARQALLYYAEGASGAAELWQGPAVGSGEALRVAYLGDERAHRYHSPEYLRHILFQAKDVRVQPLRDLAMRHAPRLALELRDQADLIILEHNAILRWQPPDGEWVATPPWIRMVYNFPDGTRWEDLEPMMKRQKTNIKRIEQEGFQVRVCHSDPDFDLFYERMYVPTIQQRHTEYGAIDQRESMRERFHQGMLFQVVTPSGEVVSSALTMCKGNTLYGIAMGVIDGDPEWHGRGALSALYYYTLRWCLSNGIQRFDMGECRPFTTDGIYNYKRHWGMMPSPDIWGVRRWLFWAPGNSPAALKWMKDHPVVQVE